MNSTSMAIQVPPGFRFRPTDAELISYYLHRKEKGLPLACDRIVEKQVYGDNAAPWKVFAGEEDSYYWNDCEDPKKKMIFVFCKLSKVGNSNKKICRVAGCGTWEGKSLSQNVKNSVGGIIGKKRAFTFKEKKGFESEMRGKGHWIMHELSVDGYDYVVCRITRHLSKEDALINHDQKKEDEITTVGKLGLKRKFGDGGGGEVEEEDGSHVGKKLCGCGGGGDIDMMPSVDDLIDISFLLEDGGEEEMHANVVFID